MYSIFIQVLCCPNKSGKNLAQEVLLSSGIYVKQLTHLEIDENMNEVVFTLHTDEMNVNF
mgnify:CR=1 FL=1